MAFCYHSQVALSTFQKFAANDGLDMGSRTAVIRALTMVWMI